MSDDYSAPLGLDRGRTRPRPRIWPFALGLAAAGLVFLFAWAILFHDPDGGEPVARVTLPALPPTPSAAPVADPAPPEPPDDADGQIIIRDP